MATEKEKAKKILKVQVDKIINDSAELGVLFAELGRYKSPTDEGFYEKLNNLVNKVLKEVNRIAPIPEDEDLKQVLGDIIADIILDEIFSPKKQESSAQNENTSPSDNKVVLESDSNVCSIPVVEAVENDRTA